MTDLDFDELTQRLYEDDQILYDLEDEYLLLQLSRE